MPHFILHLCAYVYMHMCHVMALLSTIVDSNKDDIYLD